MFRVHSVIISSLQGLANTIHLATGQLVNTQQLSTPNIFFSGHY